MGSWYMTLCCMCLIASSTFSQSASYTEVPSFRAYSKYAGIATADFNGDGFDDIALSNTTTDSVEVYLNLKDGTFGDMPDYAYSFGTSIGRLLAAEFDAGGSIDIAVITDERKSFGLLRGNGDGSFTSGGLASPTSEDAPENLTAVHATSTQYFDIAISNGTAGTMTVYLSNGDGTFGQPAVYQTSSNASWISAGDLDNDGDVDLAVGHDGGNNIMFHYNDGNGDYTTTDSYFIVDAAGHQTLIGEFNGDAYNDIAIVLHNYNFNTLHIAFGDVGGGFTETQVLDGVFYPRCAMLLDVDRKNGPDVVTSDQDNLYFFMNDGRGTFVLQDSLLLGNYQHAQFVLGYFDGDQEYDIAIAGDKGTRLYLSSPPSTGTDDIPQPPPGMVLHPSYPNPVHGETTCAFELPERGIAVLSLYTMTGQEVKTLSSGIRGKGPHVVSANLQSVPAGTYYLRLQYNGISIHQTLTVVQ